MFGIKTRIRRLEPDWLFLIKRYRKFVGGFPNFLWPQTFNEKVLHRIIFDRRPLLTQLADKFAVRSYVESRLGPQILPELYYVTTDPATIPFDQLPGRFVVKPTHGSGWVQIVMDKASLDRSALIENCRGWLRQNFYEVTREWAYKRIKPRIIAEQFIDDGSGGVPRDYKLFVFGGKAEMIQVDAGRFTVHTRRLYGPRWEKLPVLYSYDDIRGDVSRPVHLEEMIRAAETIGRELDFIRVDFYDTPGRLYFGELTMTPECGTGSFRPKEFDRYLGSRWPRPTQSQVRRRNRCAQASCG
jgi:hypothetical protein